MGSNADESSDLAAAIIAVEAAPSSGKAHFELGAAYLRHDMFADAIAPLERARELDPGHAATHLNLSTALTHAGDGVGGEVAARVAIALDPNGEGYFCLGNALRHQGLPEAAAAMFRKHLELHPFDSMGRCNLGLALGAAGRHRDALHELQVVLDEDPNDVKALQGAGLALWTLGDRDAATSMARRLCDIRPGDIGAWWVLGHRLAEIDCFEESLDAFEHLIAIDPHHLAGNVGVVAALINLGRLTDAIEHCERAMAISGEHHDLASLLAIARGRRSRQPADAQSAPELRQEDGESGSPT